MDTGKQSGLCSSLGSHGSLVVIYYAVVVGPEKWRFNLKFDFEGQGQLQPKTIGILTKLFRTFGPNLVILPSMSRGALGCVEVRTSQHLMYAKRTSLHPSAPSVLPRFWGAGRCAPPGLSHLLITFISNCMAELLLGCAPPSTSWT